MKPMVAKDRRKYNLLINDVGIILEQARRKVAHEINSILVKTYWEIGKKIIEFEQQGLEKADYGSNLLDLLSQDLKLKYGRGFSRRNVLDMRRFYLNYLKWQTVSAELGWSHYVELLSIEDLLERNFYKQQCIQEKWSVRELSRQINSALFQRMALSKNQKEVIQLSKKGQVIEKPEDIIKDPYILEFLKIPGQYNYTEKELEQRIIDNLQLFLLELGKGFAFVARQFRITIGVKHFYVDLVFYHRILKCFVLIDLKVGSVSHQDVGQMNLYLNYFKKEESQADDNSPIGIILSARKDDIEVEFALGGITNQLFVSKYKLYLPERKELEMRLRKILKREEE